MASAWLTTERGPKRRHHPIFGTAVRTESSPHGVKLPAEAARRHCNSDACREAAFGLGDYQVGELAAIAAAVPPRARSAAIRLISAPAGNTSVMTDAASALMVHPWLRGTLAVEHDRTQRPRFIPAPAQGCLGNEFNGRGCMPGAALVWRVLSGCRGLRACLRRGDRAGLIA